MTESSHVHDEIKNEYSQPLFTPIVSLRQLKHCFYLLKSKDNKCIHLAFSWHRTPQGPNYWRDIADDVTNLTKEDISTIKCWMINFIITEDLEDILMYV